MYYNFSLFFLLEKSYRSLYYKLKKKKMSKKGFKNYISRSQILTIFPIFRFMRHFYNNLIYQKNSIFTTLNRFDFFSNLNRVEINQSLRNESQWQGQDKTIFVRSLSFN